MTQELINEIIDLVNEQRDSQGQISIDSLKKNISNLLDEHIKNNSVLDDVISCKNCGSDKTELIIEKRILCNDCVCSYYL